MSTSAAYASILLGFTAIYLELMAPGWVLPAVVGAVLVMLGIAALSAFPLHPVALLLLFASLALIGLDARWRGRGFIALLGGVAMLASARELVAEPYRIRWWAAALSIPFALLSARLLTLAWMARYNKMSP